MQQAGKRRVTIKIDPRMFITGPFGTCPNCGEKQFGTFHVSNNVHVRRCRACWHTKSERLPPLAKKLVYLDQMVLSNIAKELDPEWRERTGRSDPFWLKLYDQLERLVKLQLVACPESPIHEKEAPYDDRMEQVLRRLYEHLACGVRLDFREEIRTRQL